MGVGGRKKKKKSDQLDANEMVSRMTSGEDSPVGLCFDILALFWCPAWPSARSPPRVPRGTLCDLSSRPKVGAYPTQRNTHRGRERRAWLVRENEA